MKSSRLEMKNYEIKRWYYVDMVKAMDSNYDLKKQLFLLMKNKQPQNFGRK